MIGAALRGHPLHPVLAIAPLSLLAASVAMDVARLWTHDPAFGDAARWALGAGVISGMVTALPGVIDYFTYPSAARGVPLRHGLLSTLGLALMAAMCKQLRQEHSRWLSCRPLQLVERTWQPFEAPESLRPMFQELISVEDSEDYSAQKRLLEQRRPQEASGPFVGSVKLVQFKDSERVMSYSVWPDGVDTLLPLTDLVAFASHDKPDQAVIVAWADAVRIAGHYMQPVDGLHPPRMRVNVFPNGDEQAQLRAVKAV